MAIIYSHSTALDFWRWHAATSPLFINPRAIRLDSLPPCRIVEREALSAAEQFHHDGERVHLLISDKRQMHKTDRIRFHTHSGRIPHHAICKLSEGLYVVSPEMMFLMLAKKTNLINLIALGYELVGSYVLSADDTRGFCQCDPLTSTSKLERFIEHADGVDGVKNARLAVPCLIDGSASPMETFVSMLLCLPKRLGGYGLPKPQLNRKIELSSKQRYLMKREYMRADMMWEQAKLAIEYESNQWHSGEKKFIEDSKRRNDIRHLGFDVTTITLDEFKSDSSMDRIAADIARKLNRRRRTPSIKEIESRASLRAAFRRMHIMGDRGNVPSITHG